IILYYCFYYFYKFSYICLHLYSFPTRRSSDLTILLRKIERNRIAPDGPKFKAMNAALAKNSMGAIIKKFDVKAYNEDHSAALIEDRKSTRLNSSHVSISYAVFCLKKTRIKKIQ